MEKGSSSSSLTHLKDFQINEVLDDYPDTKRLILEGRLAKDSLNPAIVILEKMAFNADKVHDLLQSTSLKTVFLNDIYGKYECFVEDPSQNSLKADVIYPATEKHIAKYKSSKSYIIDETPALYQTITLPNITKESFNLGWIYNILDHKKETERIVYEDSDSETGFILLPDFKWTVHNRKLKSLRDLNSRHLPLLKKLLKDGCQAIGQKYNLPHTQLRVYVHYQPSFYHLHVHFTHVKFNAGGINVERAHLLSSIIKNIERQANYYELATLPFMVQENNTIFRAYAQAGFDFGLKTDLSLVQSNGNEAMSVDQLFRFFTSLGKAKHEPCGEHWDVTYAESAWRMAIMSICLSPEFDRKRILKISLTSAFTCIGKEADQDSEWEQKLFEVREFLCQTLPLDKAAEFYELYSCHVNSRRGCLPNSMEARAYRKILELEEAILLWEEIQKEGGSKDTSILLRKMQEVGFPGTEKMQVFGDDTQLRDLLGFILKVSELTRLKRTGWIRSGIRDPETVAGHMFRMAVMALLLEENLHNDTLILNGSSAIVSLIHDMAECIVGDLVPDDPIAPEEKHKQETEAMKTLVKDLPTGRMSLELFNAFERYETQHEEDPAARLTKDLDKFDMVFQAFEYEQRGKKGPFLEQFFRSTQNFCFKHPKVKQWDSELRQIRLEMHNK